MELRYFTRDAKGNDIEKIIVTKQYESQRKDFLCPICKKRQTIGIPIKSIVSSKFTDWAYVDEFICEDCSSLFSLYFYSYIIGPDGIRLLNVRQLRDELVTPQKTPFKFIITTTQKKHLFYKSTKNHNNMHFAVNLETETIWTSPERMKLLFEFVENLQTLGQSKEQLKRGEISFVVLQRIDKSALDFLQTELTKSREIQIPLYCGQKTENQEEKSICIINSILRTFKEQKQH